jgi:hypothetical protein
VVPSSDSIHVPLILTFVFVFHSTRLARLHSTVDVENFHKTFDVCFPCFQIRAVLAIAMPPKAKKAGSDRAAALQAAARLDMEIEEEKARQGVEHVEALERATAAVEFYRELVAPASRMMVPRRTYNELKEKMRAEGEASASRVLEVQKEARRLEAFNSQLHYELVQLRREVRGLTSTVLTGLDTQSQNVQLALRTTVTSIDNAIKRGRLDASESAHLLNRTLEQARQAHLDLAQQTQAQAQKITAVWQEHTSMHSRIPPRIRQKLRSTAVEDLLLVLDGLSFEEGVLKFLLYRFPPELDDPFAVTPTYSRTSEPGR